MISTIDLGQGSFPDIARWRDRWVVASHEGDALQLRTVSDAGEVEGLSSLHLGTTEGLAFPRLCASGDRLALAWRESRPPDRAMLSHFDGSAWTHEPLTPAGGNHPVCFGHGYLAWQDRDRGRIVRRHLESGHDVELGPVCAMGLSRILPDGSVRTTDDDGGAFPVVTRPAWCQQYAVAERPDAGLWLVNLDTQAGHQWAIHRATKTPRLSVGPDGTIAVVSWGDWLPVRVDIVDPSELTDDGSMVIDPSPAPFNLMPYLLGDLNTYPHQTAGGATWDIVVKSAEKLIYHVLSGNPYHRQIWRYDSHRLYLHWDDWYQEVPGGKKEHWGYTFRNGEWLRRTMAVGDEVDGSRNRIIWYDRRTGAKTDESGLPYVNRLVAKYGVYPCGQLGFRPAIEWHYCIGDAYREVGISVFEWGLFYWWSEKRGDDGVWRVFEKGQPFDRRAPADVRVTPHPTPMPTTVYPVVEEPPRIRVLTTYPRTLTGRGREVILEAEDTANPGCAIHLELRDGSVHLTWRTRAGTDRTGTARPVVLQP